MRSCECQGREDNVEFDGTLDEHYRSTPGNIWTEVDRTQIVPWARAVQFLTMEALLTGLITFVP